HHAMIAPYDLIVLDVMLPDIDGWRILRSLRESGVSVQRTHLFNEAWLSEAWVFSETPCEQTNSVRSGFARSWPSSMNSRPAA
ncbi:MAG: hypothetical protein B7X42_03095, partial [Thiomonas sp. 14-66-4]